MSIIGKERNSNQPVTIDIPILLKTRLLIQANSGGGKSYLLRKILEQTHKDVQQIVLDMEGEFASLREKYDYVLVGKDGDIDISLKIASLLPRKLLELNTSAIIDLYELKHHERILFVKRFLEAMVNAPKSLWKPCMVVVDEAHIFAPEKSKAESLSAIIDLATRGRKRGYVAVLATQRISKLHKDVCAEMINKLIGRTGLDIDMKRAADELGFTTKSQALALRNLSPGQFFAFGPAISQSVIEVQIDKVATSHPEAGEYQVERLVPPPRTKIKAVLGKLNDLPQEAAEELHTVAGLQDKIRTLKRELRKAPRPEVDTEALSRAVATAKEESAQVIDQLTTKMANQIRALELVSATVEKELKDSPPVVKATLRVLPRIPRRPVVSRPVAAPPNADQTVPLRAGAMRMLKAVAMLHPHPISKAQIATLSAFSVKGGTFQTYLSELKRNGWLEQTEHNGALSITDAGLESVGDVPPLPTSPNEIVAMWAGKFRAGAARMLRAIAEAYPMHIPKEELADLTGFTASGGTFQTYLSELRRNGLIEVAGNEIRASKEMFLDY